MFFKVVLCRIILNRGCDNLLRNDAYENKNKKTLRKR